MNISSLPKEGENKQRQPSKIESCLDEFTSLVGLFSFDIEELLRFLSFPAY